jgi:hypothetical protein
MKKEDFGNQIAARWFEMDEWGESLLLVISEVLQTWYLDDQGRKRIDKIAMRLRDLLTLQIILDTIRYI